ARQQPRQSRRLDRQCAGDQARRADASQSDDRRTDAGPAGVPGAVAMSAIETAADFPQERARLSKAWTPEAKGIIGWIGATDHKELGLRYIVTALLFFTLGGIEAA